MGIHKIIIFQYLFIFISSLKYVDQSDTTYNEETGQYEFKLYFTSPNAIDDNIMFSFSQGEDEDGNEENVVFCEINPIERRLLRNLNIRNLDEEITANCVYDVIKDPDKQLIFDNPEIRGVNGDVEIEGDFTVYFKKPNSSTSINTSISTSISTPISTSISTPISSIISTINNIKSTIPNSGISSGITTIPKSNPSSLLSMLLNPSTIISIKNSVISEEIIQTVSSTTPGNNTNDTNFHKQLIVPSSSGLSAGQICAIIIPCLALLIAAIIAASFLKRGIPSGAAPPMANIITPNCVDTSSLAKVNVPQEVIVQSIQPNPVQPQITTINNPVVNRVFEPITPQNAQIVPVQQIQMSPVQQVQTVPIQQVQTVPVQQVQTVPAQEITQVQVPMTHTRGVSSAIGFTGAPQ